MSASGCSHLPSRAGRLYDITAGAADYSAAMCMQCAATAAVAVGSASGIRAWLQTHGGAWLTPKRMRAATIVLLTLAVLASGVAFDGSG